MSYKHITPDQRNELSALKRTRTKQKEIAQILGKDRTTIYREITRNKNKDGKYDARIAKQKTKSRRIKANQRFRKIENNKWLRSYLIKKLKKYWSPEQIGGRIKVECKNNNERQIGKDGIYKFIYEERKDLVKYLRCQKGKYRRRYGTRIREKQREEAKKKRIDIRPEIVGKRSRIGDWEGDTIAGSEKTIHILTHVERKSGMLFADKLEKATAESTEEKTIKRFEKIPRKKKHTLTYDNGSAFASHQETERKTKIDIYFAYPYHSWERGSNENANGLLRQFFPKKSSFADIDQKDIDKAYRLINNRPRKRLNYLTPYEMFYEK